jgi:phosphoglycolate phosphatase
MLAIFDWDGTLSDSTDKIVRSMQLAAADMSLPRLPSEPIKNIIGLSLPVACQQLYPQLDSVQMQRLAEYYSHHYVHEGPMPSIYPGARDTLSQLKQAGIGLAIATGKSRRGLDRALAESGLKDLIDFSCTADESASKPNPAMLQRLLAESGLTADVAVMIGDTEFDLAMAHAIGMPSCAVSFGAHAPERLLALKPLACVDALLHLPPLLLAHWGRG